MKQTDMHSILAKSVVIALLGLVSQTSFAAEFVVGGTNCKVHSGKDPKEWTASSWTGNCVNSYIHGNGTLQWYKNGEPADTYVGEFKDGKRHGQGTYTFSNGRQYVGKWKNGEMVNNKDKINSLIQAGIEIEIISLLK